MASPGENVTDSLTGMIERVTFHNPENGFCVLRVKAKGERELLTVVGKAASVHPGEFLECSGEWIIDKQHGRQFRSQTLQVIPPSTLAGMEKYLASGLIKGIGPSFAKKLIQAFGASVFDVIEKTPEQLQKLPGVGKKRQESIVKHWAEQKVVRDIMVFLQSYGIGTARAVRIFKTYGEKSIEIVRENPYRLSLDIRGIGFKTADALALSLGLPSDSIQRAEAGVRHVLSEQSSSGDCAAFYNTLVDDAAELLSIPKKVIQAAIQSGVDQEHLMLDSLDDESIVFLAGLFWAESGCAEHFFRLKQGRLPWGKIDFEKALPWVEENTGFTLSDSQREAVQMTLKNKVGIITGGPGVGKTTIVHSILQIISARKVRVGLCAPTGRAAKRLTETTGLMATTIHRLLSLDPQTGTFKYHQDNPLDVDYLIVDESSMIDVSLMNRLLQALPKRAGLLLVGDVDQLPSVGPGSVLSDCIQSQVIPTVHLTEIFRQAGDSKIIVNAHRINQGKMPLRPEAENCDFYALYVNELETLQERLVSLVSERLPNYFQLDPLNDIQVLTPMNRGGLGTQALNVLLQEKLNGGQSDKVTRFGTHYAMGDKVIQTLNNYDKEVFNGDIGRIKMVDLEESILEIDFDGRTVLYDFNELDEISLAYAITIHKSQGSEYPVVVIPLATQHYTLLARNLLYTAVTRGKRLVVLLGQKRAVALAVHDHQGRQRLTKLAQRLINAANPDSEILSMMDESA